jgi:DNA-binding MarR family transcriptional regulator
MAGRRLRVVFDEQSEPIDRRIAVGLQKLGLALKHREWSQASDDGLSPTQGQILAALALEGPLSGSELAARIGVTLPTISDSARALVDKGAVDKRPDPRHPRASLLALTARGRALARRVSTWPDFLASAVGELSPPEQEVFLAGVVKMIRSLQDRGLIPTSRMCVTCRYFRPNAHAGAALPHHCDFVDAPMADRHLRVDCDDHQALGAHDAREASEAREEKSR